MRRFVLTFLSLALWLAGPVLAADRSLSGDGRSRECCSEPAAGDGEALERRRAHRERMRQLRLELQRDMDSSSAEPWPSDPRHPRWRNDHPAGPVRGIGLRRLSPEEREHLRHEMRGAWRAGPGER